MLTGNPCGESPQSAAPRRRKGESSRAAVQRSERSPGPLSFASVMCGSPSISACRHSLKIVSRSRRLLTLGAPGLAIADDMADARSREGPGEWNACPATLIELDRTPTATVISPAVGYRKWPVRSRRCISFKGPRARATCHLERGSARVKPHYRKLVRRAKLRRARARTRIRPLADTVGLAGWHDVYDREGLATIKQRISSKSGTIGRHRIVRLFSEMSHHSAGRSRQ